MPTPKDQMFPATREEISTMLQNIDGLTKQPRVKTDEELIDRINWYFNYCIQTGTRPGVEGMALACGLNRQRLWDAQNGRFKLGLKTKEIIEDAKQKLVTFHEALMLSGKINPVTGIFLAKANYDYREVTEISISPGNGVLGPQLSPEEIEKMIPKDIPLDVEWRDE